MKLVHIYLCVIVTFVLFGNNLAFANDTNQNGQVEVSDAIFALQVAAGSVSSSAAVHSHSSLDAGDGDPADALQVDNDGNVGIGTATPSAKLDVSGAVAIGGSTVIDSDGKWVGDSTGLVGPQGPAGPEGPTAWVNTVAICVDGSAMGDGTCSCTGETVSQVTAQVGGGVRLPLIPAHALLPVTTPTIIFTTIPGSVVFVRNDILYLIASIYIGTVRAV